MVRLFFFVLFIPFFLEAQDAGIEIQKAEKALAGLKRQEDSLVLRIESLRFRKIHEDIYKVGLPKALPGEKVIDHLAYSLVYDEKNEQAKWVAHILLPDVKKGNEGRTNDFRPDPLITTGSAEETDYFLRIPQPDSTFRYDGFGYDRGHLAPSADFRYSKAALSESYYYSNISPQLADFNRGRWAELEDLVRQYAIQNNTQLYIVTGGVLHAGLPRIERGPHKVAIPSQFFKVVLDLDHKRTIGFLMPNKLCDYPLMYYACSIDSIESLTGLDFYYQLPDEEESRLEHNYNASFWLGQKELGEALPLKADSLPRNTFNTIQAQHYMGKNQSIKVCGTVVSTKLSSKGNIFLNLDKKFPNQVFTMTIFKDDVVNFSYQPDTFLSGKVICITGKVTNFNGTPTINISDESAIQLVGE